VNAAASRRAVLTAMAEYPARLATTARRAATRATPDGEWSPEQVVRHLIAVETGVHQARLRDLATVAEPRWDWTEPGPWPDEPKLGLEGVIARFSAHRAETLAMVEALDAAGWARSGQHATFGTLDVAGLLRNAVDHDEEHLQGLRS
jgi:DinB superfamily